MGGSIVRCRSLLELPPVLAHSPLDALRLREKVREGQSTLVLDHNWVLWGYSPLKLLIKLNVVSAGIIKGGVFCAFHFLGGVI